MTTKIDLNARNCNKCKKPVFPEGISFEEVYKDPKFYRSLKIGTITSCSTNDCLSVGFYHGKCFPIRITFDCQKEKPIGLHRYNIFPDAMV